MNINGSRCRELAAALQAEIDCPYRCGGYFAQEDPTLDLDTKPAQAHEMIISGKISAGMIPKVEACIRALNNDVSRSYY